MVLLGTKGVCELEPGVKRELKGITSALWTELSWTSGERSRVEEGC